MKKVIIYTDGGCEGNPGPGGWAAVLLYGEHRLEISGGEPATTNNRMELTAAIQALQKLTAPCQITLHTDSQYLRDGVTKWVHGWKRNGWRTAARQPVKNVDLWQALDKATQTHQINWQWVKGHAGNPGNERCDVLANIAIAKVRQSYSRAELKSLLKKFSAENSASQNLPGLG